MRPGISYTADGNPFMRNPGSFAFSRAAPKSPDRQQGPLAEPPRQSTPQPAQQQFGSSQSAGDYSAYSPSSGFAAYAPGNSGGQTDNAQDARIRTRQWTGGSLPMDRARHHGYHMVPWTGGPSSEQARMSGDYASMHGGGYGGGSGRIMPPPQGSPPGVVMIGGLPAAVQDGSSTQREIDRLKQAGTWDDPRNAKARERLEQQLADRQSAPPGYFRTPDGRLEPNYIATFGGMPQPPAPQRGQFQRPPQYGLGDSGGVGVAAGDRGIVPDAVGRLPGGPGQPPPAFTAQTNYAPPQSFVMPTPMNPRGMPDFRQRDAFIASINNSLGQQMSFGAPTPQPPQLNFPSLWQQAGQMVNNGWQNPLAGLFT
jgi:hypothetical protein